jgi:hypothetical protein
MTREVDSLGFFILRRHTLVTLRFDGVVELDLHGFNGQNALSGLRLEDLSELEESDVRWSVSLASSFGLGGRFACASISVTAARPYEPA